MKNLPSDDLELPAAASTITPAVYCLVITARRQQKQTITNLSPSVGADVRGVVVMLVLDGETEEDGDCWFLQRHFIVFSAG